MVSKVSELEAVLYLAGDTGISEGDLTEMLNLSTIDLGKIIYTLKNKYVNDPDSGLQLIHINKIYKITTSPKNSLIVEKYFTKGISKNLSQSALEILSIVAYRQPITRIEIDDIRGVNSTGALQTLIWRGLVKIDGKKNVAGHPNLYVTTDYFLQYFGFESLSDLPLIEDFEDNDDDK